MSRGCLPPRTARCLNCNYRRLSQTARSRRRHRRPPWRRPSWFQPRLRPAPRRPRGRLRPRPNERRAKGVDRKKRKSVWLNSTFSFCPWLLSAPPVTASAYTSMITVPWFIVANSVALCHKPPFIARLIKGCRGDVPAGCFVSKLIQRFQRSNEHFSREARLRVRFATATGEPNAQAEDQVGR